MRNKTLYIHIGCHKTGTTSIQRTLQNNKQTLFHRGIQFFFQNCDSGKNELPDLHSWLTYDEERIPGEMRLRDVERLAQELTQLDSDIIISSENFSFIYDAEEIHELKKALSQFFPTIKIISYIRRQDQHIISHHQEGSKLNRKAEYDLWGHSTLAIPKFDSKYNLYLNYYQRLSMWGDAFGDDNLIIRVFDRDHLKNGDVVDDFFSLIGIDHFRRIGRSNTSLGFLEVKLGHLINECDVKNKERIRSLVMPHMRTSNKLLPARKTALEFYNHFRESNNMLNQRFGINKIQCIFNEDFEMYPEDQVDTWSEVSANDAIKRMLLIIEDNVYGSLSVRDVRYAAITLEEVNTIRAKLDDLERHLAKSGDYNPRGLIDNPRGEARHEASSAEEHTNKAPKKSTTKKAITKKAARKAVKKTARKTAKKAARRGAKKAARKSAR